MKELFFKTNINCGGCIDAVTPFLNAESRILNWQVDVTIPEKILSVSTSDMTSEEVITLISSAGYVAEELTQVTS